MLNKRPSFPIPRNGSFKAENAGVNPLVLIRNLCFASFVAVILVLTIIVAKYQPSDPFLQTRITKFLISNSAAAFKSDFDSAPLINITTDVDSDSNSEPTVVPIDLEEVNSAAKVSNCEIDDPIICHDFDVFHVLMRSAIEAFRDIQFHRFGKPVSGDNPSSCHMAWQFNHKEGKQPSSLEKDYRSFTVLRSKNCTVRVTEIGGYQSGRNAMNKKKPGNNIEEDKPIALIPDEESEDALFSRGKYLIYAGGGDRCKNMQQYLWSFMCMLGEAVYLNRTLVMDLSICLSKEHMSSGRDEEGDFRFYFDLERLMDSAQVMEQSEFWNEWNKREGKDGLSLRFVEDLSVTPMKLVEVEDTLIMRKFGSENYWYEVCEGDAKSVVDRPWRKLWKARQLLDISFAIVARLNWDYNGLHVERGEKAKNKKVWPNLDRDTLPEGLLSKLKDKIEDGANVYITTDEPNMTFFDPLKEKYSLHFIDEHKDLWDSDSDWYEEMRKINKGSPIEFDSYMKASVDMEVFLRAKKRIETFNDLTEDCKDGVNTCTASG